MIPLSSGVAAGAMMALADASDDLSVPNPTRILVESPDSELVFVLVATVPRLDAPTGGPPYAVMSMAMMALDDDESAEILDTVYLSDVGWQTTPSDTPANRVFAPCLTVPYNFETSIALGGGGGSSESFGVIEIANPGGAQDALLRRAWTGRDIEILVGGTLYPGRANERRLAFAEFGRLFVGTADGVRATDTGIEIALRDPMTRLETPAQQNLYAGTGGVEGGADLAGLPKPIAMGVVRNAALPLVDAAARLYQANDGAILAVDALRDNGAALAFDDDYLTSAALLAAGIAPGDYSTCLAEGYVRLGAPSLGLITADLRGDATGSGYVATAPAIARRLATRRGARPLFDPDQIDSAAFAALEVAAPQTIGLWTGMESPTVAELVTAVMDSIGGWVSFTRDAKLTGAVLTEPGAPVATHTAATTADGLRDIDLPEPAWRVVLGYRRNWSPQPADGLAGSLTDAQRQEYAAAERTTAAATSTGTRSLYRAARDLRLSTLLDDASAAEAETQRRLALYRTPREIQRREVARPLFQFKLGETHRLVENRFGLDGGKDFVVVGLAEDARRRVTTLTLWG